MQSIFKTRLFLVFFLCKTSTNNDMGVKKTFPKVVIKMARIDAQGDRTVIVENEYGMMLEKFKFNMNGIRSLKGMFQGLWSLNPFSKALSGKNGFTDVDAHTEIDGHGLILEFKQSFQSLNKGQVMKAFRQAKYQKTCTWFIEGETDRPVRMVCINETGVEGEAQVTVVFDTDIDSIREDIEEWETWSRRHSMVKGNKAIEWADVNEFIATVNKYK